MAFAVLQHRAQDSNGSILPNVDVRVRRETVGLPLVQLYADRDGASTVGNPTVGGFFSDGKIRVYVDEGNYRVDLMVDGDVVDTFYNVPAGLLQEDDSVSASDVIYTDANSPAEVTTVQQALDVLNSGFVNVRARGALGTGSDDYAAFEDAVARSIEAGHKTVFVPPGTYDLGTRLLLNTDGLKIFGLSRRNTTIRRLSGATLTNLLHIGETSGNTEHTGICVSGIKFDGNGSCSDSIVKLRNVNRCDLHDLRCTGGSADGLKSDTATTAINTKLTWNSYVNIETDDNDGNGCRFIGEKESSYDQIWTHLNGDCGAVFRAFEYDGGTLTETTQCTIGQIHADDNTNDGVVFDGVEKYTVGVLSSTQNLGWAVRYRSTDVSASGVANNTTHIAALTARGNQAGGIKVGDNAKMDGASFGIVKIIGGGGIANEEGIHLEAANNVQFGEVMISLVAGPGLRILEGNPLGAGTSQSNNVHFNHLNLNFNGQNVSSTFQDSIRIENSGTEFSFGMIASRGQNTSGGHFELDVAAGVADVTIGGGSLQSSGGSNAINDASGAVVFTGRLELDGLETNVTRAQPGYAANRYTGGDSFAASSAATLALVANTLYAMPFNVGRTTTFTRISIDVTTNVAGNARLGIFNCGTDGLPTTLVLDAGTVSTGTNGIKEITISQRLQAGFYFLVVVSDATATIRAQAMPALAMGSVGVATPGTGDTQITKAFTYAALSGASPFGAPTFAALSLPLVMMRVV